jgi:signal transduction histidine kinase
MPDDEGRPEGTEPDQPWLFRSGRPFGHGAGFRATEPDEGHRRHSPGFSGTGSDTRFRPPWWPENEPFPPAGRGPWRWGRKRFARRLGLIMVAFFALTFTSSALAVALLSGALGLGRHRGLAATAGILGLILLFSGFAAFGRAVRRTAAPLSDVMEAADRVAEGDYDVRVEERGYRDMRRLARAFNAMIQRLRASEEHRRNLLADVAHELRTPLSVIQGHAEGMLDGLYPSDRAHLEPMLEETRVMARLLEDLQTLSTAEAGALRLHRQTVEPAQLVEDAVATARSQAEAVGIRLVGRIAPSLPSLEVDPVRIGEVLANLLSNSIHYTPWGGSIVVSADLAKGEHAVQFAVEDSGPGISPEALPHGFDRFVRAGDSKGAGLGLAIAKSLVEAHGGAITAENRPDHGTRMRFDLPAPAS